MGFDRDWEFRGPTARLPRSTPPVRTFNLGDKSEDVFGSRDNGALPRPAAACLWAASRKHRGLFVLNLSPLSKSMPEINSGFYGRAAGGAQLNALYMSFCASGPGERGGYVRGRWLHNIWDRPTGERVRKNSVQRSWKFSFDSRF